MLSSTGQNAKPEKLKVIKETESKSQRKVAEQFGVSVGTVSNIMKKKKELLSLAEENHNPNVKTVKRATYDDLDSCMWQWFLPARSTNM